MQLGAAFAFAIVISILIDVALQLNVWRVIGVSGRRAQELGNLVAPGLGWVMAAFLLIGGLVFNIGNVSGAGLGTDAMFGLEPRIGGGLSALIAIGIFLSKQAGVAIDRIVVVLGLAMIVLTTYIAITSGPPVGRALRNVVLPEQVDVLAITTLAFVLIGAAPTTLLFFAGASNGLLLPIGIAVLLWVATRRADLMGGYRYPRWLLEIGWIAWLITVYLAVTSVRPVIDLFS